jgi:hypothetical protein
MVPHAGRSRRKKGTNPAYMGVFAGFRAVLAAGMRPSSLRSCSGRSGRKSLLTMASPRTSRSHFAVLRGSGPPEGVVTSVPMRTIPRVWMVLAVVVASVALSGCTNSRLTRTGPAYPAKPHDCRFHLFTTPPEGAWTEVGVIDSQAGHTRLDRFEKAIAKHVCESGGDAALVWMNGNGQYIKATVLVELAPPAPPLAPAPVPAPVPAPATQGCQHDNQCKGDRICVEGACVVPAAPADSR